MRRLLPGRIFLVFFCFMSLLIVSKLGDVCMFWSVAPFFASRSAVSLSCIPTCEVTQWKAIVLPCLLRSFIVMHFMYVLYCTVLYCNILTIKAPVTIYSSHPSLLFTTLGTISACSYRTPLMMAFWNAETCSSILSTNPLNEWCICWSFPHRKKIHGPSCKIIPPFYATQSQSYCKQC
jgi:hypothetical protein